MICQKCNHILTGSESFCPDCGAPLSKEKELYREPESPSVIFSPEKDSSSRIFSDEAPRHLPPEHKEKKSKAGLYLIVILCAVIIGTFAVTATQVFDFTPAIAALFSSVNGEESTTEESPSSKEYDPQQSVIPPSVNYRTYISYVTGEKGQALRKGPDESYGQMDILPVGTTVHIIGAQSVSDNWVYVYAPESDVYGWISDSFLSASLSQINPDEEETTEKETEKETKAVTQKKTESN